MPSHPPKPALIRSRCGRHVGASGSRGFSLVDSLLALSVGALVVLSAAVSSPGAADARGQQTAVGIEAIVAGVKVRYPAGYAGLDNAVVVAGGLVPKTFTVQGSSIMTPGGGSVRIAAAWNDAAFAVTVKGLSSSECALTVRRLGNLAAGIGAGAPAPTLADLAAPGSQVIKVVGGVLEPSTKVTQCGAGSSLVELVALFQ